MEASWLLASLRIAANWIGSQGVRESTLTKLRRKIRKKEAKTKAKSIKC